MCKRIGWTEEASPPRAQTSSTGTHPDSRPSLPQPRRGFSLADVPQGVRLGKVSPMPGRRCCHWLDSLPEGIEDSAQFDGVLITVRYGRAVSRPPSDRRPDGAAMHLASPPLQGSNGGAVPRRETIT